MSVDLRDLALDPAVAKAPQGAVDATRNLGYRGGRLGGCVGQRLSHSPQTLKPGPARNSETQCAGVGALEWARPISGRRKDRLQRISLQVLRWQRQRDSAVLLEDVLDIEKSQPDNRT